MKLLFTQEQPQIHYITLKYENWSKWNQTWNFTNLQASTIYNNTINITNLFIIEAIITKSGFPVFEQVRMGIQAWGHCFDAYKSSNTPLQPT